MCHKKLSSYWYLLFILVIASTGCPVCLDLKQGAVNQVFLGVLHKASHLILLHWIVVACEPVERLSTLFILYSIIAAVVCFAH